MNEHKIRIAYSLPQGFRKKLEKIMDAHQILLTVCGSCSAIGTWDEYKSMYQRWKDECREMIEMMEYSKQWDDNFGNRSLLMPSDYKC